ncbi:uncharacterized protein PITG_08819 [Phytophthora infestans T30-4]|uniref:SET domain-containing protein n=1 Tax=Phytophthora infestans (strain T30-4) TaxID=403677 RepID=D0ND96_PHYIT|nr:uncharacterized protein PITG_08819 [Phytophthora infestans T30-4]EEY56053.1 conserved hypothetical protein [Phytophthora infestans T30-4]|eukprot:XP_002902883.1 conserved hypothetical protein [Phytophthora infestans T30-4]
MDWCGCDTICRPDGCPNALGSVFCARNNCLNGSDCGNRLRTYAGGNITRFMNHSCAANCRFYEAQNRRFVTVVVVTMEDIRAGSEVTLNYGDELWFKCQCGADGCCGESIISSDDSS